MLLKRNKNQVSQTSLTLIFCLGCGKNNLDANFLIYQVLKLKLLLSFEYDVFKRVSSVSDINHYQIHNTWNDNEMRKSFTNFS